MGRIPLLFGSFLLLLLTCVDGVNVAVERNRDLIAERRQHKELRLSFVTRNDLLRSSTRVLEEVDGDDDAAAGDDDAAAGDDDAAAGDDDAAAGDDDAAAGDDDAAAGDDDAAAGDDDAAAGDDDTAAGDDDATVEQEQTDDTVVDDAVDEEQNTNENYMDDDKSNDDDFYQADTQDDGENWENEEYSDDGNAVDGADDQYPTDTRDNWEELTDDDQFKRARKIAQRNFFDMFQRAPRNWNSLQWFLSYIILFVHGLLFLCCCLACVIPECCRGKSAKEDYVSEWS